MSVKEFYDNKVVFITGATGFLGKFIVEKLLSATNVSEIYILIRGKKNVSVEERMEKFKNDPLFQFRIPKHMMERLIPVPGDVSMENLGINDSKMMDTIRSRVQIVINTAATIKFDEPLKTAMKINVCGTNEIIQICRNVKNLLAFIQVSTSYANANVGKSGEEYLPVAIDPFKLMDTMSSMDEEYFNNVLIDEINEGHFNTYTFTKNLAEKLVKNECIKYSIPCSILRPSVIIAPEREILQSYVDGLGQGTTLLVVNYAVGMNRIFPGHQDKDFSIVHVDHVANSILVAGWKLEKERNEKMLQTDDEPDFDPKIYGIYCVPGNQTKIRMFLEPMVTAMKRYPTMKMIRPPRIPYFYEPNTIMYHVVSLLVNTLFAFIFDTVSKVIGSKVRLSKLMKKSIDGLIVFAPFFKSNWTNRGHSFVSVVSELSKEDNEVFDCIAKEYTYEEKVLYLEKYWLGVRKWALGEDLTNLETARKRARFIYALDYIYHVFVIIIGVVLLHSIIKLIY